MTISQATSVQQILNLALEARKQRNSRYSLRSFARDLKLSPSQISGALKGAKGLSRQCAIQLAEKLHFTSDETYFFVNLVEFEYSRSESAREIARQQLLSRKQIHNIIEEHTLETISDWYHLPLLCLMECQDYLEDPIWINAKLKIPHDLVAPAIETLLSLGIAKRDSMGIARPIGIFLSKSAGGTFRLKKAN